MYTTSVLELQLDFSTYTVFRRPLCLFFVNINITEIQGVRSVRVDVRVRACMKNDVQAPNGYIENDGVYHCLALPFKDNKRSRAGE